MESIRERLFAGGEIQRSVLLEALSGSQDGALFAEADALCHETKGNVVEIRAILEFSNYCGRGCNYCGLRAGNRALSRYRMGEEEIVKTAKAAAEAGYRTLVLQSGEDRYYTLARLLPIVRQIHETGIAITLSVGEQDTPTLEALFAAGADRYLLKHETADPVLYKRLHPEGTLAERVAVLREIKRIGYETGGGFMIGLPGQTLETVADDLLLINSIGCHMAGIGPFVPNPKTPLADAAEGDVLLTLRAVALLRLLLPNCNLPATTSLGVLDQGSRDLVFSSGANVIMRKVTPPGYREAYEIYPGKGGEIRSILEERKALEEYIYSLNREPR